VIGEKLVGGICGQVDGSIVPGMIGLEAGQSAFGDVFAWFRDLLSWPLKLLREEGGGAQERKSAEKLEDMLIGRLSEEAASLPVGESVPVALDWLNGRRTPFADQKLKGALIGLSLGTDAVRVFRSLVESTAFGTLAIIERFREEGVEIEEVVASGGIPKKSPYVMQVMSDVLDLPVKVVKTDQSGAMGAAMFAAVARGLYDDILEAQKSMGRGFVTTYEPRPEFADRYREMYARYKRVGQLLEEQLREL
jgi:L-ribulokinase